MYKIYHKFSDICYVILSWIAVATVVSMLTIMSVEVVRRYLFGLTFIWSDEIVRLLLIFCAYFGGAAAYRKHALVSFDLVTSRLSEKTQKVLRLVVNIVLTVLFAFLLYYTYRKMISPSVVNNVSTATGLTGAIPYYGIFLGLVFLMIFTIDFYPALIRDVFGTTKQKGDVD